MQQVSQLSVLVRFAFEQADTILTPISHVWQLRLLDRDMQWHGHHRCQQSLLQRTALAWGIVDRDTQTGFCTNSKLIWCHTFAFLAKQLAISLLKTSPTAIGRIQPFFNNADSDAMHYE